MVYVLSHQERMAYQKIFLGVTQGTCSVENQRRITRKQSLTRKLVYGLLLLGSSLRVGTGINFENSEENVLLFLVRFAYLIRFDVK